MRGTRIRRLVLATAATALTAGALSLTSSATAATATPHAPGAAWACAADDSAGRGCATGYDAILRQGVRGRVEPRRLPEPPRPALTRTIMGTFVLFSGG